MGSEQKTKKIVTRFAPSPTGMLHIGGFRTALFNYLYAKHLGGRVILRIEDTDRERSKPEYEKNIRDSFLWLGIKFDEEYKQSERAEIYKRYLLELIEDNKVYVSKEDISMTEEEKKTGAPEKRSEVIRFKNPNKKIVFHDLVRGDVTFDTTELGDFVIAKSVDEPLYHFAVVVDDHEMAVTHVIRGEDHISNTPRQILIGEAIGAIRPIYAHIPLILAADRSKLSKRRGALGLTEYRNLGFLPEAIINYMALLGWNPGTEQEIFTLGELVKIFDISKVQKSGAIYNEEKLRWINKEHLKKLPPHAIASEIKKELGSRVAGDLAEKIASVILERISVFADIREMVKSGELDYLFNEPEYSASELLWRDEKNKKNTISHLEQALKLIESADEKNLASAEMVKDLLWNYAERKGKGSVLWPIRFALTGKAKSPDPFTLISILGKKKAAARLAKALEKLESNE